MSDYYAIQKLRKRAEQLLKEKHEAEQQQSKRTERDRLIAGEPPFQREMHFFCPQHGDFVATGAKVVQSDWTAPGAKIAFYEAFGDAAFLGLDGSITRGKACKARRRITDRLFDSFYTDSWMLHKLRIDMADDLLQPNDPRFKAKYGDPYKKDNNQ